MPPEGQPYCDCAQHGLPLHESGAIDKYPQPQAILRAAPRPQLAAPFYLDEQVERVLAVHRELMDNG